MHKTRSKANGDNELYTTHNGRPLALKVNFASLIRFQCTKLDLKLIVTMNCILHTTVGLVHSPGAPPTSFTYSIPRINCTPGSRSASLQNGPCTPTTQDGLKRK